MTHSSPAAPAAHVGTQTLDAKQDAKQAFQEQYDWPHEPRRALLCIPTGVSDALGGTLLMELLPGLLQIPIQVAILGKGSSAYGKQLMEWTRKYPHRLVLVPDTNEDRAAMLMAADMALFCFDPSQQAELRSCRLAGAVPIAPRIDQLQNYDPNQESGNAFLFESPTVWHAFAAVVRAVESYRFPYDWKTIQRHDRSALLRDNGTGA